MWSVGFAYAAAAAIGNSCIDGSRKLASQRFTVTELIGLVGLLDAVILALAVFGCGNYESLSTVFTDSDIRFLRIAVVSGGIKVIAGFLYQRALQLSPLSVTIPYLAFTPVLLVFTSFVLMHEMPSSQGLLGVVVVTIGGYLLGVEQPNEADIKREKPRPKKSLLISMLTEVPKWLNTTFYGKRKLFELGEHVSQEQQIDAANTKAVPVADEEGIMKPYIPVVAKDHQRSILGSILEYSPVFRVEQGSLLMLGVAGLLSISSSLDKMGSHFAPSPFVFAAVQKVIMAIPMVLFLGLVSPSSFKHLFGQLPALVSISFVEVVAFVCYLKSLETLLVAYSIAAKRSNVLISVIIGRLVFKEKILKRLPFILLMVGGMILIILA